MLEVVVFDCSNGGLEVAKLIEAEMPIFKITCVTTELQISEKRLTEAKIFDLAEHILRPYIGKVAIIIFANYGLSLAVCARFVKKYPQQKFMHLPLHLHITPHFRRLLIMGTTRLFQNPTYQAQKRQLASHTGAQVTDLNCQTLCTKLQSSTDTKNALKQLLSWQTTDIDTVILGDTQFWKIQTELQQILGWRAQIVDLRPDLLYRLGRNLHMSVNQSWKFD